jgi:CRP/FNR family transcriptional regulator, cyclic AMP receptor protein
MEDRGARDACRVFSPSGVRFEAVPESSLGIARLLELDPDLGNALSADVFDTVRAQVLVRVATFRTGSWKPRLASRAPPPGLAVLIIDGLLVREIQSAGRASAELLGTGDVIFPWDIDRLGASTGVWSAIAPGHAVLLDESLFARIAPWPSLTGAIASRSARRGRVLAALALTRRMRRIDERLVFIFALFAERWGRVRPEGIYLPLPVTHEILGRIVGARRQSVTTALGDLRARGLITALTDGRWLLAGPADPAALLAHSRVTIPRTGAVP